MEVTNDSKKRTTVYVNSIKIQIYRLNRDRGSACKHLQFFISRSWSDDMIIS